MYRKDNKRVVVSSLFMSDLVESGISWLKSSWPSFIANDLLNTIEL